MNVGFAIGAEIADYFRDMYGDSGGAEVLGIEFTTYQIIILVGFVLNIPDFIAILIMRDGAEMSENGLIVPEDKEQDTGLAARLAETKAVRLPVMQQELVKTLIMTTIAGVIAYMMVRTNVHNFAVDVIPVGKYLRLHVYHHICCHGCSLCWAVNLGYHEYRLRYCDEICS